MYVSSCIFDVPFEAFKLANLAINSTFFFIKKLFVVSHEPFLLFNLFIKLCKLFPEARNILLKLLFPFSKLLHNLGRLFSPQLFLSFLLGFLTVNAILFQWLGFQAAQSHPHILGQAAANLSLPFVTAVCLLACIGNCSVSSCISILQVHLSGRLQEAQAAQMQENQEQAALASFHQTRELQGAAFQHRAPIPGLLPREELLPFLCLS